MLIIIKNSPKELDYGQKKWYDIDKDLLFVPSVTYF